MPAFPGPFPQPSSEGLAGYERQVIQLLPPGALWNLETGSTLRRVLQAISDEFSRIAYKADVDLMAESDPRTATQTLEEWEEFLSLPDDRVTEIAATDAGRRVAVTQKYIRRGGQNYEFFESLCAACGYPLLSIDLFANEISRVGDRVGVRLYGANWAYSMRLNLDEPTEGALTEEQFESVISAATQAHILATFTYA